MASLLLLCSLDTLKLEYVFIHKVNLSSKFHYSYSSSRLINFTHSAKHSGNQDNYFLFSKFQDTKLNYQTRLLLIYFYIW